MISEICVAICAEVTFFFFSSFSKTFTLYCNAYNKVYLH